MDCNVSNLRSVHRQSAYSNVSHDDDDDVIRSFMLTGSAHFSKFGQRILAPFPGHQWRNNRACKACSARGPSAVGGPKFARRCF